MKSRPILFSAPMIRALLDGSKTQTRRICKLPFRSSMPEPEYESFVQCCPYGQPGDQLFVRETWGFNPDFPGQHGRICYRADPEHKYDGIKWKPSIHMFREDSRITLEITGVRVERLQDISEEDAIAEGIDGPMCAAAVGKAPSSYNLLPCAIHGYSHLWETINGAGSWNANPWVWCVEFRRVK